jgi:pimeloyl-ACP methyl ester carboxylesterase
MENSTQIINSSWGNIEYCRTGSGFPFLVSHGITGGFDQGLSLVEKYVGGSFNIIAVSRFGYLGSSLPDNGNPESQADVYNYLLESLGIDKVIIFGNSAGGTSAIRFAIHYPDKCKGLILLSSTTPPNPTMPPKPVMQIIFGSDVIYRIVVKLFGNLLLSMFIPKSVLGKLSKQEVQEIIKDIFKSAMPISKRTNGIINDMFVSNPDINTGYPYHEIVVPTLIIHDVNDPAAKYSGAMEISQQIPNCKVLRFEGGGHLHIGHEKVIKEAIKQFADIINNTSL